MNVFNPAKVVEGVDVVPFEGLEAALNRVMPDAVVNCIGITLRKEQVGDAEYCYEVNGMLPHRLKCWGQRNNARIIHFSTDCVFDGSEGHYTETSNPTAKDVYGKSKYLGEITDSNCLTLRGSIIGRELTGKTELLEWALSQRGTQIKGFSKVIYSGVTTNVMAKLVAQILQRPVFLSGLYQISSEPISKYELLQKINVAFGLDTKITEDCSYVSKKDLVSLKLKNEIGFVCPSWDEMIKELVTDKI